MNKKTKITIIGSCVCRDLFEGSDDFEVLTDIRFCSPVSILSKPINDIKLTSNFFKRKAKHSKGQWFIKNLINDFNKTIFDSVKSKHGDYLILDLAESRIPLLSLTFVDSKQNLVLTESSPFREHYQLNLKNNLLKNTTCKHLIPNSIDDLEWKRIIKQYSNELKTIFDEENIILLENMPADYYVSNNNLVPYSSRFHIAENCLSKELLPKLYSFFKEFCPRCKVVQLPQVILGDVNHKWGTHPFHYLKSYYRYLLDNINMIINKVECRNRDLLFKEFNNKVCDEFELLKNRTICSYYSGDIRSTYFYDSIDSLEEFSELNELKKMGMLFFCSKHEFFNKLFKKDSNK